MTKAAGKGYRYHVTDEQLRKYGKLSARQKLEWLEEVNAFVEKFAPPRTRELHRRFRRGEI